MLSVNLNPYNVHTIFKLHERSCFGIFFQQVSVVVVDETWLTYWTQFFSIAMSFDFQSLNQIICRRNGMATKGVREYACIKCDQQISSWEQNLKDRRIAAVAAANITRSCPLDEMYVKLCELCFQWTETMTAMSQCEIDCGFWLEAFGCINFN